MGEGQSLRSNHQEPKNSKVDTEIEKFLIRCPATPHGARRFKSVFLRGREVKRV